MILGILKLLRFHEKQTICYIGKFSELFRFVCSRLRIYKGTFVSATIDNIIDFTLNYETLASIWLAAHAACKKNLSHFYISEHYKQKQKGSSIAG